MRTFSVPDISPVIGLSRNCVAHYKLNDNAATTTVIDSREFSNGTAQQNTNLIHTTGKVADALTFNGTSDYIDTNATFLSILQNSFSMNIWVYLAGYGEEMNYFFSMGALSGSGDWFAFEQQTNFTLTVKYIVDSDVVDFVADSGITTDVFYMITCVLEKLSATTINVGIYKNAVLVEESGAQTVSMGNFTGSNNLTIGAKKVGGDLFTPLAGVLDNAMIFSKALTQREVTFLYNLGYGTEGLLA